jgi:hypothetical protein
MLTTNEIKAINDGVIETKFYVRSPYAVNYYIFVRNGYIGRIASIIEKLFNITKEKDRFELWTNKQPNYIKLFVTNEEKEVLDRIFVQKLIYESESEAESIAESKAKSLAQSQNYEKYVIIATLLLFIIIITRK